MSNRKNAFSQNTYGAIRHYSFFFPPSFQTINKPTAKEEEEKKIVEMNYFTIDRQTARRRKREREKNWNHRRRRERGKEPLVHGIRMYAELVVIAHRRSFLFFFLLLSPIMAYSFYCRIELHITRRGFFSRVCLLGLSFSLVVVC